uniref:Metal abc transporter n=1 Tax=Rhizophora mucronata TaxID=61149 RepID=A0A2P2MUE2_RHIMU
MFGWPRQKGNLQLNEHLALNLQRAFNWVGLNGIPLDKDPHSLSGGYKRRLALAIQLAQVPDLLILDEPLAGLDWKARTEVVKLLKHLKKELTVFVVSHDLKEFSSLADFSWRMEMGGLLREEQLPV